MIDKIHISPSPTADSRTVTELPTQEELFRSSIQHILDVKQAIYFFMRKLDRIAEMHDRTKLTHIEEFYDSYKRSIEDDDFDFKRDSEWLKLHVTQERHHLIDHIPDDVNLLDVIERVCDIVMAGMGRSGKVTADTLPGELLEKAYSNTVKMLSEIVVVDPDESSR
jgi:hypothetical protein